MLGIRHEDGSADFLLLGEWSGRNEQALWNWKHSTPELHDFVADYHRLQLEYWIWKHHQDGHLGGRVMDVGVENRRDWIGDGYFTFGEQGCDVTGDLTDLAAADQDGLMDGSLDAIICTEVLEHCADPKRACYWMNWKLKPGGLLLVTSPFLWPDHGTDEYRDYWRFTADGWRLLLKDFERVELIECAWTGEGAAGYEQLRQWEGWGFRHLVRGATGYLCTAWKGTTDA